MIEVCFVFDTGLFGPFGDFQPGCVRPSVLFPGRFITKREKGKSGVGAVFFGIRRQRRRRWRDFMRRMWVLRFRCIIILSLDEGVVERRIVAPLGVGGVLGSGWVPLFGVHVWWGVETFTQLMSWLVRCWKEVRSIECFWDDVGGRRDIYIYIYHLPFSTSGVVFGRVRMVH